VPRGEFDRSARKARTRAQLLEAAAGVYARRGFGGATLDEVAAEAGFTKGAVYSHFGNKENLLLALLEEHLAAQVADQIELFDRRRDSWERPLAGSARWMEELEVDPDRFRLFVELWVYAQRDERLRERVATGLDAMRDVFARFARTSAADAGLESSADADEHFASVSLGLGIGLSMIKLIEPDAVPDALLGAVLSVLIRGAHADPHGRELLADPERAFGTGTTARPA
jgi:AcrR family transcriptional regulator